MGLNIKSEQYRASQQTIQTRYIKLELLNNEFRTVDELSGVATGGNLSIDATSDIRRTGNIQLVIKDSSFEVESGGKIWLDKYIKVWVGVLSNKTGMIEWTNCGIYIIDAPSYSYDHKTNKLSLSLIDLMGKFTGVRNGHIKGVSVVYKAGESIRQAIIDTVKLGGIKKYVVEAPPYPGVIPNDLEFGQGSTIYDLLKGLKNIYPNYEMFFDVNGTFIYKKIPSGHQEPILVKDDLWDSIVISEEVKTDFQNVKNSIEVYGRIHDPAYFSTETIISGNNIDLKISGADYSQDAIYGFVMPSNRRLTNISISVNDKQSYIVRKDDGRHVSLPAINQEVFYCAQFKGSEWRWLGRLQAYGFAEDTNSQSPFYVYGSVGRIRLPLYDGEYSNCITDDLAQQRAQYELWKHTNLNDAVTMTIIPVPWLDVNILVERTLARNKQRNLYLIKSISYGLSPKDTGTVNMIKYYPESPQN